MTNSTLMIFQFFHKMVAVAFMLVAIHYGAMLGFVERYADEKAKSETRKALVSAFITIPVTSLGDIVVHKNKGEDV